jgi:hypothetical protein
MFRVYLIASLLLLKFGFFAKTAIDKAQASNWGPSPTCPWPSPPDCDS